MASDKRQLYRRLLKKCGLELKSGIYNDNITDENIKIVIMTPEEYKSYIKSMSKVSAFDLITDEQKKMFEDLNISDNVIMDIANDAYQGIVHTLASKLKLTKNFKGGYENIYFIFLDGLRKLFNKNT